MSGEEDVFRLPSLDGEPPVLPVEQAAVARRWAEAYDRIVSFESKRA